MRTRKAKGKKPGIVTLTEGDILHICHEYLRQQGYDIGQRMVMKIPLKSEDKRRQKLEIMFEMETLPDQVLVFKKPKAKSKAKPRSIFSDWKPTNET